MCTSNDVHVLALALVSGARLLYTNDAALIMDFKNSKVIANPRGKVYTTSKTVRFTTTHKATSGRARSLPCAEIVTAWANCRLTPTASCDERDPQPVQGDSLP